MIAASRKACALMTATLEVTDLRKQFAIGRPAIDGVSFAVPAGEIVVLLGPSGCGKTTTLRCVAGLEHPTIGRDQHRRQGGVVARARHSGAAAPARTRHGVSVLCGVAAHDGAAERGLSAQAPQAFARRRPPQGRRGAGTGRPVGICRPAGGGVVGRPDAARGAGAQHRLPAATAAARRAAVESRCQAAPAAARRSARHPQADRHDRALRHPRPGRSGGARRPHRRDARRQAAADGYAGRDL